jgi:CubicO group peptidase (beta-lactamase class C family)
MSPAEEHVLLRTNCGASGDTVLQVYRWFGPSRRAMPDGWIEVPGTVRRPCAPAGGGISTATDIARFGASMFADRLVSAAMRERTWTSYARMSGDGAKGYGELYDWYGTQFVGHGGNFWGLMSQLDTYPSTGLIVVVLSNNDASGGEALRNWTRRAIARLP